MSFLRRSIWVVIALGLTAAILIALTTTISADETLPAPPAVGKSDEQIRAEAFAAAEAKKKAAEESGTIPPVIPFGADPEHPDQVSEPPDQVPPPRPDYMPTSDPNATELEHLESVIRYREVTGLNKVPHCFYGPVTRRIPVERLREIAVELGETDASWRALQAIDDDPNLPEMKIVVYAPGGPTCKPDLDKELAERREELLKQQESGQ